MEHPDRRSDVGVTEALFDVLAASDVHATAFLQGRWVEAYPEGAARIVRDGHLIGSHSFYHARMPLFTPRGFRTDVLDAQRAIRRFAGVDPRPWFRCPFGAGGDDPRVLARLDALGYREVGWDVSSNDWAFRTAAPVLARVVTPTIERGDGTVVLFHGWPRSTIAAMPSVIRQLREAGARFVGIDELERLPRTRGWDDAEPLEPRAGRDGEDGPGRAADG